jgi:tetratricopeptide (TPR) repeat protein
MRPAAGDSTQPAPLGDEFSSSFAAAAAVANADALDHDPAAARTTIVQYAPANDIPFLKIDADEGWVSLPVYWIAAERGDWRAALADARASDDWLKAGTAKHGVYGFMRPVFVVPLEALALARTGDVARAEALIATTPADCYLCARVRGQIAAAKKDWPTAARWFAEAVRLGPSIPFAYSEGGAMLLAKGDAVAAIAQFKLANAKGSHFADPLELWGEALMAQNRSDLALAKFEDADRYAPRWGHLHLKWGEALYYAGRKDEARKEFAVAAGLELSRADRAALAKWMTGAMQ